MDRCLNINNPKVIELSKQLGLSPAATAAKIVIWQQTNGNRIPTIKDLMPETQYSLSKLNLYQKQALDIFFKEVKDKKLSDLEVTLINKKLKAISDRVGDTPWFLRLSKNGNYYIAGYKNMPVTMEGYYSPYAEGVFRQEVSSEGILASEKTIRDLAARMSDRIGVPIKFESDRNKNYKGKLENGVAYINLAYATLDTPIHEILGHPIIRAIKNNITKYDFEFGGVEDQKYYVTENGKRIKYFDTGYEAQEYIRNLPKQENTLYQNLLKELETGKGKEVFDRIKRNYVIKTSKYDYFEGKQISDEEYNSIDAEEINIGSDEYLERSFYEKRVGNKVYTIQKGEDADSNSAKVYILPTYTLEEQQEEAVVELLGLMTAEKLDKVKDGKLISLLKRLLKEMKAFMKQLLGQKEVEIDKLPDDMTIGDIADLLAYSNSKLILPGNEVVYTTPDNQQFKTYAEASKHITELAKSVENVDLSNIGLNIRKKVEKASEIPVNKFVDEFDNTAYNKKDDKWYVEDTNRVMLDDDILTLWNSNLSDNYINKAGVEGFIKGNKQYEQSKEIIEEWKKINNIQYNPEEVYSRGQEFVSVVGAYSSFDVNLMMQNLLSHIEDNEKAGGKFAISAFTKPVDRQIGHLEGGGGKIKFKIYPKSNDILWAANTDVFSGSVWDASEKVSKDKKSELLGVSYSKYPALPNVTSVQPNLASIIDNLEHHHNELGIVLTGNNFRLEYDEDIPYSTKKIIDSINSILDQKYGKLVKPEIKEKEDDINEFIVYSNGFKQGTAFKDENSSTGWSLKNESGNIKELSKEQIIKYKTKGIQPTQTNETLKESINNIKSRLIKVEENIIALSKQNYPNQKIGDIVDYKGEKYKITGETVGDIYFPASWNVKPVKEYTSQALINTKIAALKEAAKKYPRSLIRSEVRPISRQSFSPASDLFEDDELPFQLVSEDNQAIVINSIQNLQGKQKQEETYYTVEGFETKLKRPSSLAKKTIQDREQFKTDKQIKDQEVYTGTGNLIHSIQAEVIRKAFPEANGHLQPLDLKGIGSLYDIVASDKQLLDIIKEAKAEGTVLMAEVFVGNLKLERGGTIDLLGVTKDGNYKLYDLKTRYTKDKGIVARYNKLEEFTKQLGEYKKILEEGDVRLGIPKGKLLTSKVIESKIDIDTKTGKIKKFNGNEFVAPFFLRTENAKLNDFINRLDGQIKVLKDKKPKDLNKVEAWEKLLTSKLELMQSLQLQQDVNDIIEHSVIELATIKSYMLDQENMDTKDLVSQLLMFASIDDYVDYDSLNPKQQALVRNVKFEAERLYKQVLEMGKNMIVESAVQVGNEKFVDEIFSPIKDITFLRKMVMGVSDVDHPLVNTGYKVATGALAKARAKLDEFRDKLVPLIENLRSYMNGLDYSIMLNENGESLVGKYSSEFWREYNVNKKKRDLDWARKNLVYDKEAYNEAYKKRNQFEESIKENELNKIRAWLSLKEDAPTDPDEFNKYVENVYWKGRKERFENWFAKHENNTYFYFKPKDKWIDSKWKEIKEGKYKGTPVEEFYDFYTNTMAWANEYVPEHIRPTFIANFTQSFLERSSDLGLVGAIQGKWSELFNNLDLEYDEALYGKIDPYTGEQLRELFVPGLSKVRQAKSTDLGKSLLLFIEGVYRYQELSVIENTINHIRTQIKNSEEVRVDALGNVIDDPTKVSSKKNPAKQVSELFDYYVDAMLYNKYRKAEGGFELKGNGFTQALGLLKKGDSRKVSYAKLADGVVKYTGIRNLAGNLFAPLVNLLGASANQYMTGFGGLYYSNKDLAKSQSLLTAGKAGLTEEGVKLRMIIDWLGVDREKVQRDVFGKISKNKLEPILEKYNGMTLFRESEILLVESGAGAMILSDKYNIKMEDFDVVQGKLVLKKEFTPLEKEMFRQKVLKVNQSNIGAMNSDDVVLAKKWIVGRMLMQHRSWLAPLAYKRWGAKRYDYILEKEIEGRYRVAYRALKFIIGKGYSKGMESLSPEEVAYAKEAFAELMLVVGTGMLLFALKGVDDEEKKEAWYKYTNTVSNRLFGELFFFMDPTGASQFQILLSPAATTSTVQEFGKLMRDSWREVAADMYDDPETVREKAKPTKRIIKMTPGLGQAQRFIDELYNPEED